MKFTPSTRQRMQIKTSSYLDDSNGVPTPLFCKALTTLQRKVLKLNFEDILSL